jgi:hypothetical protein
MLHIIFHIELGLLGMTKLQLQESEFGLLIRFELLCQLHSTSFPIKVTF